MSGPTIKRRKLSGTEDKDHSNAPRASDANGSQNQRDTRDRVGQKSSAAEFAVASGQYKSSIFKFQIDELFDQLRLDYDKVISRLENHVLKLKNIIENIPESPSNSLQEVKKQLKKAGVAIPFPESTDRNIQYNFEYAKPVDINIVGSFALRTGTRKSDSNSLDLAVTIPAALFQKKDYLNYRYFFKRAYYLACIAAGIKNSKETGLEISYTYQNGNSLQPILVVEPTDARANFSIRIITAVESETFAYAKTLPLQNNLTQDISFGAQPSAVYNGTLRSEACVDAYLKLLHGASLKCAAYKDSCVLGRAWLRQRGFGTSFARGGFGHFEWAAVVALLLENGPSGKPLLSGSYSSYQIFKTTLQFLSEKDLTTPLVLHGSDPPEKLAVPGCPVLFDGIRHLNILYKMTSWSYEMLRRESAITLRMLNNPFRDNFDNVFITKVDDPLCKFDQVVSLEPSIGQPTILHAIEFLRSLHHTLTKALGNRASIISIGFPEVVSWSTKSGPPDTGKSKWRLTVGLSLDSSNHHRLVDHGPSVEEKEAASAFQKFWGSKAELRRFKDGTIAESLVWSDRLSSPSVVEQIITYILPLHLEIFPEHIRFIGNNLSMSILKVGAPELHTQASQPVLDDFRRLEKKLQEVELPLAYRQLSLATSVLRLSNPGSTRELLSAPLDVVLQFEDSARWPDNLKAIQMTKVAFLHRIGSLLANTENISSCQVGLEDQPGDISNIAYLEIRYPSLTFRLRIYHDREQLLLERQLKREPIASVKEELAFGLFAHKRDFVQKLKHAQTMQMLSTRFPLLSSTIAIFKAWVSAHLFAPFFHEELLELFVCQTFLSPHPWSPPLSPTTAFLRTLHQLARWDWQHEPLIVDINDELNAQDIADIEMKFKAWRKIDPEMKNVTLFVASTFDREGVTWTQFGRLPRVVASKFFTLTKAASKLVRQKSIDLHLPDLYRSPLSDYNFILHLNPKFVAQSSPQSTKYKNLQEANDSRYEIVTSFVDELRRIYGEHILFFHGDESGKVIAGLWNPRTTKERPFSLKTSYLTSPSKGGDDKEGKLKINKTAVLNGIASIGGDIISRLEIMN